MFVDVHNDVLQSRCFHCQVSSIQNNDDASLQAVIGLASGRSVRRLISQTLDATTSQKVLERIGAIGDDESCADVLAFHADVLLAHLAFLFEVNTVHSSFPWCLVLAFRIAELPGLMFRMNRQWKFVTECLDKIDPKQTLAKAISWTRSQAYREAMIVGE